MILGKYQIVQRLGGGGMGTVYEAVHRDIAKPVALKTLAARLASEPAAQARFLREAASASRLTHPHVVDVTDFGSDGGITYLVMELLRGEDLAAALAREPMGLSVERIADVMLAVCAGVFAAHEAGVVHRDLKPPNIFLSHGSLEETVPKVLDFGISKLLDEKMSSTLTGTGTVLGTTPYLSPEQVAGRPVDARSDQYSLGVILYECVTGRRPHEGETLFTIMRSIADGRFRRPRELRSDVPPAFEAVIMRAMSHDPARRYETVHALGHALLPFATQRRRLLWGEYFGTDRSSRHQHALPRTEPLPELPHGVPLDAMEPLDSTRTGGRRARPSTEFMSGEAPRLQPRSRAPLVFLILLLLAGGGFGAYMMLREPPRVVPLPAVDWQPPTPPIQPPVTQPDPPPPAPPKPPVVDEKPTAASPTTPSSPHTPRDPKPTRHPKKPKPPAPPEQKPVPDAPIIP
jgi:serine/threonine protein kinase